MHAVRVALSVLLVLATVVVPAPDVPARHLAPTPYLGWNTYFALGGDPTEAEVRSIADHLATSGLRDAGYRIVWVDGNWAAPTPRGKDGELVADPARFPSGMPALTRYLHERGFQAGIYTDAGPYLEGHCGLGSDGHYRDDVRQFAAWGFDALKADWLCGRAAGLDPETSFRRLAAQVQASPRPMILNICNPVTSDWGGGPYPLSSLSTWTYTYAPQVAQSWRTYTDVAMIDPQPDTEWPAMLRNLDANAAHPSATGPGHYNDPDYLLPMRPLPTGGTELTFEESRTQLAMWSIMAAPLIIGSDPRTLPTEMTAALTNPEILAVDQDPLARQGEQIGTSEVWSKPLTGTGTRAVALLNRTDTAHPITVTFAAIALAGPIHIRNLWTRTNEPTATGSYTVTVPAHGTAMLRLTGTELALPSH